MAETDQPQVFLSYAHADRARVAKLAEALSGAGLKVWWDTALDSLRKQPRFKAVQDRIIPPDLFVPPKQG